MYIVFLCIVIGFLDCKVTTFFHNLYRLPMENMQRKENANSLIFSKLQKTPHLDPWKVFCGGMERKPVFTLYELKKSVFNHEMLSLS